MHSLVLKCLTGIHMKTNYIIKSECIIKSTMIKHGYGMSYSYHGKSCFTIVLVLCVVFSNKSEKSISKHH